jgi:bifunctional UDP-N-acetylglucosamine pyrophosphorylase/glucosamine-1-phosphate N-acetyltransferase
MSALVGTGVRARRTAVVLAAGKGTRMVSDLPKVLHRAAGRPLLAWVLDAARAAGCTRLLVVVGHGAEQVRAELTAPDIEWVLQAEQRGTGHALAQAEAALAGEEATLLVLSGDVPLLTPSTLSEIAARAEAGAWGALAVAELADPGMLGRVIPRQDPEAGPAAPEVLGRIVEHRDATPAERAVRLVNAGIYALPAPRIFTELAALRPDNAQGELYLTDALSAPAGRGERLELVRLAHPDEALGVNNRAELALVHRRLIDRHLAALMTAGVTVLEPARTVVEPGVAVGPDTVLHPDVALLGSSQVGSGCTVQQGAWLRDSRLGDGVEVLPYSVLEGAAVDDDARVGPFARLRPGAHLRTGARVGNFVEVKNAELGPGAKAGHLAYLGDATVGAGANIGAGVVTCNFDGRGKHRTEIGAGAFVGSDTMLVAPVRVGEGATTAAGSVITKDVPAGGLAVGRARQKNLPGRLGSRRGATDPPEETS